MIHLQSTEAVLQSKLDRSNIQSPARSSMAGETFAAALSSEAQKSSAEFESAFQSVVKNKRGLESGQNPMKYGILQTTLTNYDPKSKIARRVEDLTEDDARKIYGKIWERAGCDKLPSPMNAIHFETYVQRPSTAADLLKKSNGDPVAYQNMREKIPSLAELKRSGAEGGVPAVESTEAFLQRKTMAPSMVRTITPFSESQANGCATEEKLADFESAVSFVIQHEGSRVVPNDNGKGRSKFGILQKTLRQIDPKGKIARNVSQLDEKKARAVYRKIWERTGCDKLPRPLNMVHFDTVVHSPRTAQRALGSARGNPETYLETRLSTLKSLKSFHKYGKNWEDRIDRLARLIK